MTVHDPGFDPGARRRQLVAVLLVGIGGFLGSVARYAIAVGLPAGLPLGTLAANVLGSFALGVLVYEVRLSGVVSRRIRLVLGTGFLSFFTTFSTFAVETLERFETGGQTDAAPNVLVTVAGCLLAVGIGAAVVAAVA